MNSSSVCLRASFAIAGIYPRTPFIFFTFFLFFCICFKININSFPENLRRGLGDVLFFFFPLKMCNRLCFGSLCENRRLLEISPANRRPPARAVGALGKRSSSPLATTRDRSYRRFYPNCHFFNCLSRLFPPALSLFSQEKTTIKALLNVPLVKNLKTVPCHSGMSVKN